MNMEKSNNTNHIKFTSNPMYSFYGLYRHCMQNPEMATNAIKGFENERLMSLMEVIPEKGTNARIKSNLIQKEIVRQNISSYEGLKKLLSEYLPQEVDTLDKVLKPAFEAYSSFYDENKEAIDKNIETMNSTQAVYRNELLSFKINICPQKLSHLTGSLKSTFNLLTNSSVPIKCLECSSKVKRISLRNL